MSKVNSRAKGIRGELEVCKLFQRWFPDTHRNGEKQRSKTNFCPDIGGTLEEEFYVEVKRYKKIGQGQIRKWWDKCVSDFDRYNNVEGYDPWSRECVLACREDGGKWRFWSWSGGGDQSWGDFKDEIDQVFEIKGDSK